MSLPAVLNEVISVTGVITWPFSLTVNTLPDHPVIGVSSSASSQPLLITAGQTGTTGTAASTTAAHHHSALLAEYPRRRAHGTAAAITGILSTGFLRACSRPGPRPANRGVTTDYAAPAIDIPTFRRRFACDRPRGRPPRGLRTIT